MMIRKMAALPVFFVLLFLFSPSLAESPFPDFMLFAGLAPEETTYTENSQTCTLVCSTDENTLLLYKNLLAEYSLVPCASVPLSVSEEVKSASALFYSLTGQQDVPPFTVQVNREEISCHLMLQDICFHDESHRISLTWSRGLRPEQIAAPTPEPKISYHTVTEQVECIVCDDNPGVCPMCEGNKWIKDYLWDGEKLCEFCNGSGKCKACDGTGYITVERIVPDNDTAQNPGD